MNSTSSDGPDPSREGESLISPSHQSVVHMAVASFFFSLMGLCVKFLSHLPTYQVVFFRAFVAILLCLWMIRKKGISPWGTRKKILLLRGIFGTAALFMFFSTLQNIPLATAVTLMYLSPVLTSIFAIFILGEEVKRPQWFFFALSFAGIVVIKGFDPHVPLFYFLLGIGAAITSALAYNCIGKIKRDEDPLVIIFYFPLVTVPIFFPPTVYHWVHPSPQDWVFLILVGVVVQIAQYFMTLAYQGDKASTVSIVSYLGIVFAIFYGWFFFGETLGWGTVTGIALVLAGVICNTLYQGRKIKKYLDPPVSTEKKEATAGMEFKVTRAHLKRACEEKNWDLLDKLLEIDPSKINDKSLFTDTWGEWWGLLIEAVRLNAADGVKVLLKHGAKKKVKTWGDCIPTSPLEMARSMGKPHLVKLLEQKERPTYERKTDPPLPELSDRDHMVNRHGEVAKGTGLVFPFPEDEEG